MPLYTLIVKADIGTKSRTPEEWVFDKVSAAVDIKGMAPNPKHPHEYTLTVEVPTRFEKRLWDWYNDTAYGHAPFPPGTLLYFGMRDGGWAEAKMR